jgi:transposase
MAQPQKDPLRALSTQEENELRRIVKATSERGDVVRRAKALLAVADGQNFAEAAGQAGLKSGYGVSKLAKRFNEHGLSVLTIAVGRGRKPTYTSQQQALILAEVQREPDRKVDQTATWSLMLLRQALRKKELPHISAETIRQVLHEHGYSYQQDRTWCHTGYALRQRKSGTVRIYDPQTRSAKKDGLSRHTNKRKQPGLCNEMKMKLGPMPLGLNREQVGNQKAIPSCSHMNISAMEEPS